jgi:aryl-alcohol dehydrogenase-like predicted oxidoreductase
MEHRVLGAFGPEVSAIGFGAWPIGGGLGRVEKTIAIDAVRAAIDSGITVIDTAEGYRLSESLVGEALRGGYREKCFLATKATFDFSAKGIRTAMENSLRALRVDQVDLYQLHNWDPRFPIEESMKELGKLREEGKTRWIGVSNFQPKHMEQALNVHPFQSNQVRYSLLFREIEGGILEFCKNRGIGIIVHSPLAKGLLTGRYAPDSMFPADDERSGFPDFQGALFAGHLGKAERLKELARAKGISLVQLAIAWTLRHRAVSCVLVGAKNPSQLREHLGAVGVAFSASELARIEEILASA